MIIVVNISNKCIRISSIYPSDFDRSWYSQVGGKILAPMIIAMFLPQLFNLLLIPLKKCMIQVKAKSATFQKDLNKIFTPPELDISLRNAVAMNILFVSVFFSSGMPLLYIIAFLTLTGMYYSDKYIGKLLIHGIFLLYMAFSR